MKTDKILTAIVYCLIYACVAVQTFYGTIAVVALIAEAQQEKALEVLGKSTVTNQ